MVVFARNGFEVRMGITKTGKFSLNIKSKDSELMESLLSLIKRWLK